MPLLRSKYSHGLSCFGVDTAMVSISRLTRSGDRRTAILFLISAFIRLRPRADPTLAACTVPIPRAGTTWVDLTGESCTKLSFLGADSMQLPLLLNSLPFQILQIRLQGCLHTLHA